MTTINATSARTIPSASVRLTPTATIEVERLVSTTELADAMGVSRQSVINGVMYCTVPEPDFIIGKAWGWKGSRLPKHLRVQLTRVSSKKRQGVAS